MAIKQTVEQEKLNTLIGKRIQSCLDKNNMTHEQLASFFTIDRVSLTRYINGQRQCPTAILAKIADICNTSIDYLCGRSEIISADDDRGKNYIQKETGLSEESIKILYNIKEEADAAKHRREQNGGDRESKAERIIDIYNAFISEGYLMQFCKLVNSLSKEPSSLYSKINKSDDLDIKTEIEFARMAVKSSIFDIQRILFDFMYDGAILELLDEGHDEEYINLYNAKKGDENGNSD